MTSHDSDTAWDKIWDSLLNTKNVTLSLDEFREVQNDIGLLLSDVYFLGARMVPAKNGIVLWRRCSYCRGIEATNEKDFCATCGAPLDVM